MNTRNTKKSMLRLLMAMLMVLFAFNMTACDDDDDGGSTGGGSNSINGTITFTYNGAPIDQFHWPHSSSTTDSIPGYFRLALMPCDATGMPTGGPVDGLPALGHGTGMEYSSLSANGTWDYTFQNMSDGKYIVAPTYENIVDPNSFRKTVGVGHWGDPTKWNYGSPVLVSGGAKNNINMICDIAVGINMVRAVKRSANTDTTKAGTIVGSLAVNDFSKWPTGSPYIPNSGEYLALIGSKTYSSKAEYIANPGPPDIFAIISKPDVTGANMIAFCDSTDVSFGTYNLLMIDVLKGQSFVDANAAPLDVYESNQDSQSFTLDAASPMILWHADVTLP